MQDGFHSEPPHLLIACAFLALPGDQARLRESSRIGQFHYYPTFWVLGFWGSPTIALPSPARIFRKNLLHQQIRRSGSSWDKFRKIAKLSMLSMDNCPQFPCEVIPSLTQEKKNHEAHRGHSPRTWGIWCVCLAIRGQNHQTQMDRRCPIYGRDEVHVGRGAIPFCWHQRILAPLH